MQQYYHSQFLFVENDNTNELLCVWVYPKLSVEWKDFISTRCQLLLDEDASSEYIYGQHSNQWYYIRKYAGSKEKEVKLMLLIYISNRAMDQWVGSWIPYQSNLSQRSYFLI